MVQERERLDRETMGLQDALVVKTDELNAAHQEQLRSAEAMDRAEAERQHALIQAEMERQARELAQMEIDVRIRTEELAREKQLLEDQRKARGQQHVELANSAFERALQGQEKIRQATEARAIALETDGSDMELAIRCSEACSIATAAAVEEVREGLDALRQKVCEAEGADLDGASKAEMEDMVKMANDYLQFAEWADKEAAEKAEHAVAFKQLCDEWRARVDDLLERARKAVFVARGASASAKDKAAAAEDLVQINADPVGMGSRELEELSLREQSVSAQLIVQVQQFVADAQEGSAECARVSLSLHETCQTAPQAMQSSTADIELACEQLAEQASQACQDANLAAEDVSRCAALLTARAMKELQRRHDDALAILDAALEQMRTLVEEARIDAVSANQLANDALERVQGYKLEDSGNLELSQERELVEAREQTETAGAEIEIIRERAVARRFQLDQILDRISTPRSTDRDRRRPSVVDAQHALEASSSSLDNAVHIVHQALLQCDLEQERVESAKHREQEEEVRNSMARHMEDMESMLSMAQGSISPPPVDKVGRTEDKACCKTACTIM
eukprot:TRINITY_DN3524_c0_g1_i2.p1 TRINITY_DN3524_c0_g1~~TRINITY_DN3524_c0_g1_i2.p1  ORF type:complete len:570 (+),score=161.22 TRINITY_DN3524_c0_g1_i2:768-2477(+)